ncbi:protein-glutamate methylesterase/protein-glutamine glutaminase [Brassicibacter mesophilus]|uniref:protein-glutamate methylesterase/protein-glutamine glutaminase n=1 Tax=Brassicibacter mesophilus TaxID=745119 RepID=UPI003D1EB737
MSIRVMVVDDSAFMRKIISDILNSDNEIDVIGTARNGKDALEKLEKMSPDVITLDIEMPIMDGISTLTEIIKKYNIPVIMLSSLTTEGADATLKALDIGAVDFIPKPNNIFGLNKELQNNKIVEKVKMAAGIKKFKKTQQTISNNKNKWINVSNLKYCDSQYLIAIGTSTGGPKALQSLIPQIPNEFNGSIVLVQHMPQGFTKSLATRLNSISNINVKEAEDGEKILKGYCYIAPGDNHMTVIEKNNQLCIKLNKDMPVSGHRPSVDVLMESISVLSCKKLIGIMLTGMGSDGSKGLKKIYDNGGYTIAQDEETCVVYGMPKSAINIGAVSKVLPLSQIVDEIMSKMEV